MELLASTIAAAIDQAPLNRGLRGSDWLSTPGNIPIVFANGDIVLFDYEGAGEYQIHVLMISRGRRALVNIKEAFRRIFDQYGADLIFGMVPDFRRDVKLMARWAGMKGSGRRSTSDGPCELFVLSKDMWMKESIR